MPTKPIPPEGPKRSKYGVRMDAVGKAERTIDGILFASKREMKRYSDLKLLGVWPIELQPKFDLIVNGIKICQYRADFGYEIPYSGGKRVIEDSKGFKTPAYRLKKKLMKAIHGIEIQEV